MKSFLINSVYNLLDDEIKKKIDGKTKPLGSLGKLEKLALKIGRIQNTLSPILSSPTILVFAGDHGISEEGVSPYPQEVTMQMVNNFLEGGAAINVFCRQNNISLHVVDAGVNGDFMERPDLVSSKIGYGTKNFSKYPAMTKEECFLAIKKGADFSRILPNEKCNVIGFGEMGIGNTSSASALMQKLTGLPIEKCVGKGTGLDDLGLDAKRKIIQKSIKKYSDIEDTTCILSTFGGFEIAMMVGAMLESAVLGRLILIDGFIATTSFLVAYLLDPKIKEYAIFTHFSNELGHAELLKYLNEDPLLFLEMSLGEGTGVALAYPLLKSAVLFLNEMESFESAGVKKISDFG